MTGLWTLDGNRPAKSAPYKEANGPVTPSLWLMETSQVAEAMNHSGMKSYIVLRNMIEYKLKMIQY